ncbi:hypothetical protein [Fodinibius sp.]|uniref:hypothetical protein n=1 Tax=Fodinibius sp. TaxID=1872440 RepID=UPI002ACE5EE1|nr:hypothetical protein [Fodinibius sp.]MDZ7658046.1 hypothetical protein [Fodinibius sp.]
MRPQTKKMLKLLKKHDRISDLEATGKGVINPRREAGILIRCNDKKVNIIAQSGTKREYELAE